MRMFVTDHTYIYLLELMVSCMLLCVVYNGFFLAYFPCHDKASIAYLP